MAQREATRATKVAVSLNLSYNKVSTSEYSYSFGVRLMDRNKQITIIAIFILSINGCTIPENTSQTTSTPAPAAPAAKSPGASKPGDSFSNPVVSPQPNSVVATLPSVPLIQSTDPNLRLPLVSTGRQDPFAQITGQPGIDNTGPENIKKVPTLPQLVVPKPATIAKNPANPTPKRSIALNPKPKSITRIARITQRNNPPTIPVLPKVLPQVVANNPITSQLPPKVEPDGAKTVFVSGVVMIGKEIQAIIKVPEERTSRYVQAGTRLINGVIVKRIEMNEGSNPVVVLEQYGIEVARMVGDVPEKNKPVTKTAVNNSVETVSERG